eukprot:TRINITY_DN7747_c0_g2_i1.p1 TRINITY_DN7747_c0_g2~~TRINITY_DN7747_c0_g2_i1.p1  ORF type:complete len:172 (+),score=16.08 TRINITY_DN7747_c0_g2_i1:479-994(+)
MLCRYLRAVHLPVGYKKIEESIMNNSMWRDGMYKSLISVSVLVEGKYKNPFHEACLKGKWNAFSYFAGLIPEMDVVDSEGNTCLHTTIESGNKAIIKSILDMKTNLSSTNNLGETPLMKACSQNSSEIALLLLDHIRVEDTAENQKALSLACRHGHIEVIPKLLNHGISIF